jgi:tetratricopeptide (TPR) repeat protein
MREGVVRRLLAFLATLALAFPAFGQKSDEDFCAGTDGTADERIAACTRAITSGALSGDRLGAAFYNRGIEWGDRRDFDRAISDYSEAVRLKPNYPEAFNNRGEAYRNKGDFDRALADYNEALRLNPGYWIAYSNRGIVWRTRGDYDRAIADYNEAIRLNPQYAIAYNNRGIAWRNKGDNDRAIADYNEALRLNPRYELAYNNRGVAWRDKRDYDRAIADYTEAIRLNPQYALAYQNRGHAFGDKGERTRALADYDMALRLEPKNPVRFNAIAWRLATARNDQVRDGRLAVEYATQACELTAWKVGDHMDTLAAAYAEAGRFEDAVRWEEKALQDPEFARSSGAAGRARLNLYRSHQPHRE